MSVLFSRLRMTMALVVGSVCVSSPVLAASVRIELPAIAMVAGEQVRLGQIAYLTTTDLSLLRALLVLPLGSVPPGAGASLDRAAIARWIHRRTGMALSEIQWTGEASTLISAATRTVTADQIMEVGKAGLQSWLAERTDHAEVRLAAPVRDFQVRTAQPIKLSVIPLAWDRPLKRMQVSVQVTDAMNILQVVPVTFDVTARAVIDGQSVDLTTAPPARRPLAASSAAAVRRGDWATLHAADSGLSIEGRVEILQDGAVGQVVRARRAGTDRSMLVRVSAPGQVEL